MKVMILGKRKEEIEKIVEEQGHEVVLELGDGPDLTISFQHDKKLDPSFKAVNVHFGKLPEYRGCDVVYWQIINGEEAAGVTLHYIDSGWDTGDIIDVAMVQIGDLTAGDIYDKLSDKGLQLLSRNLKGILGLSGHAPRRRVSCNGHYYKKGEANYGELIKRDDPNFKRKVQACTFKGKQEANVEWRNVV